MGLLGKAYGLAWRGWVPWESRGYRRGRNAVRYGLQGMGRGVEAVGSWCSRGGLVVCEAKLEL